MEVFWQTEEGEYTLEGEPVLCWRLGWPEVTGGGRAGRRINRFYARMAQLWRQRWQREVYWLACLDLARRREESRPFVSWKARLEGEVTLQREGLLSLRMRAEEVRGTAGPCLVCWGDVWNVAEGVPVRPGELFRGRGWKKHLLSEMVEQGEVRRRAGDFFPDPGWEAQLARSADFRDLWLTEEGAALAVAQCVLAPAAEGTPVFSLNINN